MASGKTGIKAKGAKAPIPKRPTIIRT